MAVTTIPQFSFIVFELALIRAKEPENVKSIYTTWLSVFPKQINYTYASRAAIQQTYEDDGGIGGWRDEFGRGLTRVNIQGTFGREPRRQGISLKDGWLRLKEFREVIVKLSHLTHPKGLDDPELFGLSSDMIDGIKRKVEGLRKTSFEEGDVFVVNYYDFFNDESFAVDVRDFQILETVTSNNLPIYTLNLIETGATVKPRTQDFMLQLLLDTVKASNFLVDKINRTADFLASTLQLSDISALVAIYDVGTNARLDSLKSATTAIAIAQEVATDSYNAMSRAVGKIPPFVKEGVQDVGRAIF